MQVAHAQLSLSELTAAHAAYLAEAERISGTSTDARIRAEYYFGVFQDSKGNFMFPLVATHGSLWGVTHTLRIDKLLTAMRPLSRRGTIQRWIDAIDAVRDVNRRVFVEIHSTFYFTREHGTHPLADQLVNPEVLALYNRVHHAIETDQPLTRAERRDIYYRVFVHEQEDIVDPGVKKAAAACGSRVLVEALRRVQPRFRYFPRRERLHFTDFISVDQRNREGLRALDFAEEVGAARVREAMGEYPL